MKEYKEDYKRQTKAELKTLIADLTVQIVKTYGTVKPIKDMNKRKKLRKEVAKIKTELNRRRNEQSN